MKTVAALLLAVLAAAACACSKAAPPPPPSDARPTVPAAAAVPADPDTSDETIRFLENKANADKLDYISRNLLVGRYLQRVRETGNLDYLKLAAKAAKESLEAAPPEQNNMPGLANQAFVDFASHDFASARDRALQLTKADGDKQYPYLLLADTYFELGDYKEAASTVTQISNMSSGSPVGAYVTGTRVGRIALLRGRTDDAVDQYTLALDGARAIDPPAREGIAWLYWQLGEIAFFDGQYDVAEQRYRDSLTSFPDYWRALGSLGRVLAAKGDAAGAIAQYEKVTKTIPDPEFVAALGDLYQLAGRDADAETQYKLVEQIGKLSELNGTLYNRQLALFWADHDRNAQQAYAQAAKEYETRKDVYGADAVAWTALKAGKLDEAKAAIQKALELGTADPRLFYHAGMIAKAAGDAAEADKNLNHALELSPQFDPLQAKRAREALGKA